MADTPDSLAATLDKIRERAEELTIGEDQEDHCGAGTPCTGHDAIRLITAVNAVLKLAGSAKATGTTVCGCLDCNAARQNGLPGSHRPQPYMWNLSPARVREAITAELTKGEATP